MSVTPRTDAARQDEHDPHMAVASECSKLEKELAAASKERDDALMMLGMYRMKSDEQKKRIKRLEEAGDEAILNSYLPDRLAVWNKAKEGKL
jgi:hypothetical protein